MAAHGVGDFLANGKAQAGPVLAAFNAAFTPVEALKDELALRFVDPNAPVRDIEFQVHLTVCYIDAGCPDFHPVRLGILEGVDQQVAQDFDHPVAVGPDHYVRQFR